MGFYSHIDFSEREEISRLLAMGAGIREIGRRLGRDAGTISRECRRAGYTRWSYRAQYTHQKAWLSRHRARRSRKLDRHERLKTYVFERLDQCWSPRQIAKRLREDYPDDTTMRISHETIYQYLYVLGRGTLKKQILRYFRQQRPYRRKRIALQETARRRKIPDMISIEERPAEVADRSVPGHWEGDLLMGAKNLSALGVLVERKTRLLLLVPLEHKDAASVRAAFAQAIRRLPVALIKSLTYDQGSEMYEHKRFTMDTRMTVYFCHPHSPWERGTCENTNGLLRQYFPKGIDFHKVSLDQIQKAERQMNGRPRAVLSWKTPAEVLSQVLG